MYGGKDYLKNQINWATVGTQPGSTFKVFALVAALEDGFSLKTRLNGSSPIEVGGNTVENQGDSGGQSFGPVTLERATQKSINTAFVDLTQQLGTDEDATPAPAGTTGTQPTGDITVGTQKIRDAANEAGIPESVTDKFDPAAAVTPLGYVPVPPVDMANATRRSRPAARSPTGTSSRRSPDPTGTDAAPARAGQRAVHPRGRRGRHHRRDAQGRQLRRGRHRQSRPDAVPDRRQDRHGDGRHRREPARVVVVVRRRTPPSSRPP